MNVLVSLDLPNNLKPTWQIRQATVLTLLSISLKLILSMRHRFKSFKCYAISLEIDQPQRERRNAIFDAVYRKHL